MTLPRDYNTHAAGSIRRSAGILQDSNQRTKKVSAKQTAARKIVDYFATIAGPQTGMRASYSVGLISDYGFIKTDKNESGANSGDWKLTAKTWNGIMKKLGISGFRIKNSISYEEYGAFLKKYNIH